MNKKLNALIEGTTVKKEVEKRITFVELEKEIGVSRLTLMNALKNTNISLLTALKIANYFGKAVEEIWDISDFE